ncbi:Rieske (2Fe-2S) protein [Amycolatopsis alkalitolerans]|uniref:Rieske (2Fe-2S) protein n=1 Tax=Amycolatopsis alkalitolerans TaxID=2547244 RepID=A0A5C4LZ91_9PSEU|nr:Rieske (2Fe-2S) protein [Amycolatopsis alkalitolerans]TNC25114.1 Rieske (2Fe-2S) protein [Amycolatopsis alkalitolerans]
MKQVVCPVSELDSGEMRQVQLGPIRVVVVRGEDGSLHALAAKCLHQGGPLEYGRLYEHHATTKEVGEYQLEPGREVLKCPWHGYEYDIRTGCTVFDPGRAVPTFPVFEEDGQIVVQLQA